MLILFPPINIYFFDFFIFPTVFSSISSNLSTESGITFPSPENIEKLLNFFHVTPNTLFSFEFDVNTDVLTVIIDLIASHFAQQAEIGKIYYEKGEKRAFEILCQYYPFLKEHDFQSAMDYDHIDFQLKLNQLITQGRDVAFNHD